MTKPEDHDTKLRGRLPNTVLGWLDIFVKAGAIFAGVFAVQQYLVARDDLRTARALEYVTRFTSEDTAVGRARANITERLWDNVSQIRRLRVLLKQLPDEQAAEVRNRFLVKLLHGTAAQSGLSRDLHIIVEFFDELSICLGANLCDAGVVHEFFNDYARTFWSNFGPAIVERRSLSPDYGCSLEVLATLLSEPETNVSPTFWSPEAGSRLVHKSCRSNLTTNS